ncbi:unnamed protein product [Closterium sp. NIES-53]
MYLMTCTRPDLAYPLSILARYVAPGRHRPEHMTAAKRVLRYLCSTSGMGLVLGGRRPVVLTGHADASWADDQATQRSSQGYTFSLGSGSVSWWSTRSSSVLSSSCEAEIYAGAMAAQELRWLTYLLTDLGEQPRSPPVLYVDNKAMLALCQEHRLEHRTKHISLRYFLARELQQRGQLRLAYVASEANTADIFTKALAPGDHQRFCTLLVCFALLDRSCDPLFSYLSPSCSPVFWPVRFVSFESHLVFQWCVRLVFSFRFSGQVVLTFDAEGRAVDFEVWLDDLQLFLQCDRADGLSLFDLTSGVSPAPPATADSIVRSQWATRDAAARLAVHRHLPTTERAHFSQYRSAQTLYVAVVARYSSPATAALSRLFLPYLFPNLAAFPTVADLITHLRTSDARYRAALPAEFCAKNPPPLYLTLYYVVTRLPDSLRVVRDHFLSVCPTTLTVDLLEERLLAAEQSIVAWEPPHWQEQGRQGRSVGWRGRWRWWWRQWRGWGWWWGWWWRWRCRQQQWRRRRRWRRRGWRRRRRWRRQQRQWWSWSRSCTEEWLRWWSAPAAAAQSWDSLPSAASDRAGEQCGGLHSTQCCFGRLTDAWRHQFPDATEIPRWGDLSRAGVVVFDLDYDAILAAMYALSTSDEGDCYLYVLPDPGIEAAALGAGETAALGASAYAAPGAGESAPSGTASAQGSWISSSELRAQSVLYVHCQWE